MAALKKKKSAPVKVNKINKVATKPQQRSSGSGAAVATIGRRKTAVARIRLIAGGKAWTVNGKPAEQYFHSVDPTSALLKRPMKLTNTEGTYAATIKVDGSGMKCQLEAAVFGIARALVKINEDHKKILRAEGLLTRDARMRESRKIGFGGKARRKKQSPKR